MLLAIYVVQYMWCTLCRVPSAAQSVCCNLCGASYVMQFIWCNLRGAIYVVFAMWCNLCGVRYVVQLTTLHRARPPPMLAQTSYTLARNLVGKAHSTAIAGVAMLLRPRLRFSAGWELTSASQRPRWRAGTSLQVGDSRGRDGMMTSTTVAT